MTEKDKQRLDKILNNKKWSEKMAMKLLPLIEMDLAGIIDLTKPITPKIPFLKVTRNKRGWVYICIKFNNSYCQTCILSKTCLCK